MSIEAWIVIVLVGGVAAMLMEWSFLRLKGSGFTESWASIISTGIFVVPLFSISFFGWAIPALSIAFVLLILAWGRKSGTREPADSDARLLDEMDARETQHSQNRDSTQ